MDEKAEQTEEKPLHDENGKFAVGHPPIGGRPKGSISIKEAIRKRLRENPQELEEIVEYFVDENRELLWQMLEGKPSQQIDANISDKRFIITDGDGGDYNIQTSQESEGNNAG